MKLKYKKSLIIIILSFVIFILIDFCAYTAGWFTLKKEHNKYGTFLPDFKYTFLLDKNPYSYILQKNNYRQPLNKKSSLEPIYIFGCSFAYGEKLREKETFGAHLAKLTGRPIYNFAFPGFGVQHMLFQLENMQMPTTKPPKYIIYIYINDHLRRLTTKFIQPCQLTRYPLYEEKNNNLTFKKTKAFSPSIFYLYRKTQAFIAQNTASSKFNLLEKHFEKANEYTKKLYPNSKFIILIYNPTPEDITYNWDNLTKKGFKIIFTSDLISESLTDKYILPDSHPSPYAWKVLTPEFTKRLNDNE